MGDMCLWAFTEGWKVCPYYTIRNRQIARLYSLEIADSNISPPIVLESPGLCHLVSRGKSQAMSRIWLKSQGYVTYLYTYEADRLRTDCHLEGVGYDTLQSRSIVRASINSKHLAIIIVIII